MNKQKIIDAAEYCKQRYEQMFDEPYIVLEARLRQNCKPEQRWLFDSIDQRHEDKIEEIRLSQRPWWKKLLRITQ